VIEQPHAVLPALLGAPDIATAEDDLCRFQLHQTQTGVLSSQLSTGSTAVSSARRRSANTTDRLGREDAAARPVPGEILNGRMIIEAAAATSRAPSGL
jgi:hypothetical protein